MPANLFICEPSTPRARVAAPLFSFSVMDSLSTRHTLDRHAGLFGSFDDLAPSYSPKSLNILWLEISPLDCRMHASPMNMHCH